MNPTVTQESFVPRRLLRGGHLQTLWRRFAGFEAVEHRRERLELDDGDFMDLDWHREIDPDTSDNGTIVLVLHGLCGSSKSAYVQSMQARLGVAGYPSVAMNLRGCSGEVNRLARTYHSGVSDDLGVVCGHLAARYPHHAIAVVGYSLGANVLLKWLGETAGQNPVQRAVAVSTPFDLASCSQAMLNGLSQLYGNYFLRRLMRDLQAKQQHFATTGNRQQLEILTALGDLAMVRTLWDFDERVTAPLHGFGDAADYYTRCSCINYLARISKPTLLVQSFDDPIIPPRALPGAHHMSSEVQIDLSESGGHVGFASAHDPFWLEHRILRFIGG